VRPSSRTTAVTRRAKLVLLLVATACIPLGHSVVPYDLRVWLGDFAWRPLTWHCGPTSPAGGPLDELCFAERRTSDNLYYASIDRDHTGRVTEVIHMWGAPSRERWMRLRDSLLTVANAQARGAPRCATPTAARATTFVGWRLPGYDLMLQMYDGNDLAQPLYWVTVEATVRRLYVCGPIPRGAA
jgi:hypothetical protein